MENLFLSIIIPTYNTPVDFLNRAVESVLIQEMHDYEIIIIDDGSDAEYKDNINHLSQNNRIRIINGKHKGVSHARNLGIEVAKGRYLAFVDADDIVDSRFLSEAYALTKKFCPDMIIGSIEIQPKDEDVLQSSDVLDIFEGEEIQELKLAMMNITPRKIKYRVLGSPCGRVYKRELVEKIKFDEKIAYCEDLIFNRCFFNIANKVLVVPEVWYYYQQNPFSAMHRKRIDDYKKRVKPFWDALYILNKNENDDIHNLLRKVTIGSYTRLISDAYLGKEITFKDKLSRMDEIAQHPLILDSIKNLKRSDFKGKYKILIEWILIRHKQYIALYLAIKFANTIRKN